MTIEQEKTAAVKADAFELGMHALLKEAGCASQEEAQQFFKLAAELSKYESKEAALKGLKALGEKAVGAAKEHPKATAGAALGAAGAAGVAAGRASKKDEKKPLFGKKK